jgi:cytochrome c biogenesis protein CcmG, thiol:disulfide interchange protein DsbE
MRVHNLCWVIALGTSSVTPLAAQQTTTIALGPTSFVSLTDPACPVTGFRDLTPHTDELHILYSETGPHATIKGPKSLVAHIVFENGYPDGDDRVIPFTRRGNGLWQANVQLLERIPLYIIYWVEDHETKQSDTNQGKYFEVPFCDPHGRRSERSVEFEAQSYTGILESHGIERPVDFAKAIEVLTEFIHPPFRGANLIASLWNYKLHLGGDTPQTRAALLIEINRFVSDHSTDGFGLLSALNFTAYHSWIPDDTNDRMIAALDRKEPRYHAEAFLLLAHSSIERDDAKRATLFRQLIAKFPDDEEADSARRSLIATTTDMAERETLYQQMHAKNPHDTFLPIEMARFYVDANQKLSEALALLAEADDLLQATEQKRPDAQMMNAAAIKRNARLIAMTRAEILSGQNKPREALAVLLPLKPEFTLGSSDFLLAEVLEKSGDKKAAVDSYLDAAIRPWKNQRKAYVALEKLWLKQKMGNKNDLQKRIETRIAQLFANSNYEPHLLAHDAPEFELTTLSGEHFSNSSLRGKTVVLNLWAVWCAPCLFELGPLQDFQIKHPNVLVLTVVDGTTDRKELAGVIRDKKLSALRVAPADFELWNKLGAFGVPNTFIIDQTGEVRIQHLGGILDVPRFLEADLAAIAAQPSAKN